MHWRSGYLVVHTRPDLAQSVGYLSRFVSAPTEQHVVELKRVLRYLRGTTNLGLRYDSKCHQPPVLVSYTDSDYGGDKNDYKSTSGFLAMLKSGSYEQYCARLAQSQTGRCLSLSL